MYFLVSVKVLEFIIFMYILYNVHNILIMMVIRSPSIGPGTLYEYLESFMGHFILEPQRKRRMVVVGPAFARF